MVKRWLPWAIKLGLSGLLIWYLLGKVDIAAIGERLRNVDPGLLAVALGLCLVQMGVCALRWHVALKAIGAILPGLKTFAILYIGMFANLVLPGAVGGDAVRMWKARKAGLSLVHAVNSVMLERIATVLGLVLLVAATEPLLIGRIGDNPALYVFPALTVLGILGTGFLMVLDRLPDVLRRWRLVRGLAYLAGDTRRLFLKLGNVVPILFYSVGGHLNLSLVAYISARALGLDIGLVDCIVLIPPVILITTIPISIAGWGVREGAMVAAFGFIGVAPEHALALSVLFGLINTVAALPGGLVWLGSGNDRGELAPARVETVP